LGDRQLGVFCAIAAFATAGNVVHLALSQSAAPRLARYFQDGRIRSFRWLFAKLVGAYSAFGLTALLLAWVAGETLLRWFFRPDYVQYAPVLVYLMGSLIVAYLSGAVYTAMISVDMIRSQVPILCLNVGTCLLVGYLLVPAWGLAGAAAALALGRIPHVAIGLFLLLQIADERSVGEVPAARHAAATPLGLPETIGSCAES
jgi:O-antigen/teichoic acid export membrane protein